jgi:hypothetical protein
MNMTIQEGDVLFPDGSVVIPTRHRAGKVRTLRQYPEAILVVEPHDALAYHEAGAKHLAVLPSDHKGLSFARQWILEHAIGRLLMLDDDITSIASFITMSLDGWNYYRVRPESAATARENLMTLMAEGASYCGCLRRQRARPCNGRHRLWAFVAMDAPALLRAGCAYNTGSFQDFDMQLQVLSRKISCAVNMSEAFDCPDMGTNKGGCNELLPGQGERTERAILALNEMLARWPKYVDVIVKPRGPEPRIRWTALPSLPKEHLFLCHKN